MPQPLLLYSTNTWLSYIVAERYYGGVHYVWCSPHFGSASVPAQAYTNPPTSTPSDVYHSLFDEVIRGDRHSAKIAANRAGILRGASLKRSAGVVDAQQEADIAAIVSAAEVRDFRPLLFIIPFNTVSSIVKPVPVAQRAHPLSEEFVIEALPGTDLI
jgi:hypothetical protein